MLQDFNIFGEYKIPEVSLHYPNRKKIGDLKRINNLSPQLRFNTYSEISLEVPYKVDEQITPFYDDIEQENKIKLNGYGYFIIQNVKEYNDGIKRYKTITGYSEEYALIRRNVTLLEGTYKFYDTDPTKNTIVSQIMGYIPNWTLEYVSSSLWLKYRTFNVVSTTLYSFMMSDVSKAYECFFVFDTENRKIYIKDSTEIINATSVYISYDNLIKNVEIEEKSNEFVTALSVIGGGDLDISSVNPVGGNIIYDFSYPLETGKMSTNLSSAVATWNDNITLLQPTYANYMSEYKDLLEELTTKQSVLTNHQSQRRAVELVMQSRIENEQQDLSDLVEQLNSIDALIIVDNISIANLNSSIEQVLANLTNINNQLKIQNNFSGDLYNELLEYVVENSYQNENIIKTSIMSNLDIQNQAQELYDQGKTVLDKISQPRFSFSMNSVNFVFLKEFLQITNQISLGSIIHVEIDNNRWASPVLLEISFNFHDPTDFSMTFANRYRLDDASYEFSELIQDTINKGSNIGINSQLWTDWSRNYQIDVSQFLTAPLNASKNELINADNQQIIIDEVGLRGKREISDGNYSPEQVWLTSNTLAFTNDSWNTVKTALGKITLPDGTKTYGLIADAIVTGTLNAGLVRIFGTNDFYWDNDNIVLKFPNDSNKEIRIGKYNGSDYGIGYTTDGGVTWANAIGFNGVTLTAGSVTQDDLSDDVPLTKTFAQIDAPITTNIGDLWIDTDDDNKLYRWDGESWVEVRDTSLDAIVSTHTTEIQTNANEISLKANQTDVNTLTGRVSETESQISVQAGEIESKVSKDGVVSAINQSAEQISIDANKINLNGVVTANNYFKILSDGSMQCTNGTFSGSLNGASGTFSGALSAATGTFSGSLSAARGSFSGNISGSNGTFYGNLSAVGGSFSGDISGSNGTFYGALTASDNPSYSISIATIDGYQEPSLYPNIANKCNVGTRYHYFDYMFANHFTDPSSRKIKKNITDITDDDYDIMKFRPITYEMKNSDSGLKSVGFIAEEVEEIYPLLVVHDPDGSAGALEYNRFCVIAIREIQKLWKINEEKDKKITELEERISRLEKLIENN